MSRRGLSQMPAWMTGQKTKKGSQNDMLEIGTNINNLKAKIACVGGHDEHIACFHIDTKVTR
jgi:hypothetical protein